MKKIYYCIFIIILIISSVNGCSGAKNEIDSDKVKNKTLETNIPIQNEKWKSEYTSFLKNMSAEIESKDDVYGYCLKDLDNNKIPELIISKNALDLTIYSFDKEIKKIGNGGGYGGTTRFLFSNNTSYPGIIIFYVGGGLEHYGYMTVKDNKVIEEELWNEDFSGISEELGQDREVIEEISSDKELIKESKKAYKDGQDLQFKKLTSFSEIETTVG